MKEEYWARQVLKCRSLLFCLHGMSCKQPARTPKLTSHPRPLITNQQKVRNLASSVVTGLSLHTKTMSAGGLASAVGKSPTISRTSALFSASSFRVSASTTAKSLVSSVGFQSSSSLSPWHGGKSLIWAPAGDSQGKHLCVQVKLT